jgi:glycosyltransferase involved in cell wall biosynthesis
MNEVPLVSVLIPLYNKVDYFEETLQSVLNQTYPNIEIIIVDDGSTDGSLDIAKNYLSKNIIIFEQENKGASAARNKAFELSKGDYIQYLDADDILDQFKIEEQVKVLDQNYECLAISKCYFIEHTPDGQKKVTLQKRRDKDFKDPQTFILDDLLNSVVVHAWLIPRHFIENAGGWDERISNFDDKDFYLRLLPLAAKIIYCDKAICSCRDTNTNNHLSKERGIANLQGVLLCFSNAENILLKGKSALSEIDKKILSCFYKKLFIIGLNHPEIKESLYNLCLKFDVVPDCSNHFFIRLLKKILGVKLTFKILALYLQRNV